MQLPLDVELEYQVGGPFLGCWQEVPSWWASWNICGARRAPKTNMRQWRLRINPHTQITIPRGHFWTNVPNGWFILRSKSPSHVLNGAAAITTYSWESQATTSIRFSPTANFWPEFYVPRWSQRQSQRGESYFLSILKLFPVGMGKHLENHGWAGANEHIHSSSTNYSYVICSLTLAHVSQGVVYF